MAEPIAEYTVRDFSAVDTQIKEISERENVLTQKLKISNYKQISYILGGGLLALGAFLILLGISYRIAFPPEIEIIEKTKIIDPQKIVIQTPVGASVIHGNQSVPKTGGTVPDTMWGSQQKAPNRITKNIFGSDLSSSVTEDNVRPSNQLPERNKNVSVIGNRNVTTFTYVASNLSGYKDVISGWMWNDKDAQSPSSQYCYVLKEMAGNKIITYLARIQTGVGEPVSAYNSKSANDVGLSEIQWNNLERKCRWWPN
jgi:hypothetical protein